MDGEDVMKGKVHKERREHWKEGSKREREREREREKKHKKKFLEKKVNMTTFMQIQSPREHLYRTSYSFVAEKKRRFSLVLVLGQNPLLLFFPISYKIYWFGPGLKGTTHYSKWAWATNFCFLTLTFQVLYLKF